MDVVCAKSGRHFGSWESLDDCRKSCKDGVCPYIKSLPGKRKSFNTPESGQIINTGNPRYSEKSDNTPTSEQLRRLAQLFERKPDQSQQNRKDGSQTDRGVSETNPPLETGLKPCPKCHKNTLRFDTDNLIYRCKNLDCNHIIVKGRIDPGNVPANPDIHNKPPKQDRVPFNNSYTRTKVKPQASGSIKPPNKRIYLRQNPFINSFIKKWKFALLLIFALCVAGIIIDTFVDSLIPFWLLLGFGCFFSIEKWFLYPARKYKVVGNLYRLILNLSLLALLGLFIWSGVKLFSHSFIGAPLFGTLLFIGEIVLIVWLWRVVARNSWLWPSMKLTVFTLIGLLLLFSFAGIQPLASYKDKALDKIQTVFTDNGGNQPAVVQQPLPSTPPGVSVVTNKPITPFQTITPTQIATSGINSRTGVYKDYYLGLVNSPDGNLSGNGCYDDAGDFIILINNKNAQNPTYSQLVSFLLNTITDQFPYKYTPGVLEFYHGTAESHVNLKDIKKIIDGLQEPGNPCVCADFAERLHNDAEMAGIRCAYVSLDMEGYSDPYQLGIPSDAGHACNAFQTTDKGLIYIDVTNAPGPSRCVKTVNIQEGEEYIPRYTVHNLHEVLTTQVTIIASVFAILVHTLSLW